MDIGLAASTSCWVSRLRFEEDFHFLIHKDEFEKKHHILISGGEISESIFVDEESDGGIVILTNNTCFLRCEKNKDILLMERFLHQFDMVITVSHYLQGFIHLRWCRISSINSTYRWQGKILEHKENNILQYYHDIMVRIQVCPRKGISSTILFWGWDVETINPTRRKGLDS